jgi:hypothetical protein
VYVLEDDPKFQKEIAEAISAVDFKIQIRFFPKLEMFVDWLKLLMTEGPKAIAAGGMPQKFVPQEEVLDEEHQLVLVAYKVEFLGEEQLGLMRKTRRMFIDRKVCSPLDPTAFVLTAFDNPDFDIRKFEDPVLNNVILKPFDQLILIQHLTFAIDGRHPPSKNTVTNQKTTAVVELLKDVEMEAVSDVGFITKSDREIKPGVVCKYYSQSFMSDRHRSLFAICRDCVKHPDQPDMFRASFTFFAIDQTQISNMRKKTRNKDAKEFPFAWTPSKAKSLQSEFHVILLDEEEVGPAGLIARLEKTFSGVHTSQYQSFGDFYSDLDPTRSVDERDSSIKALGGANSVTLHFDATGHTYLDCASDKQDLTSLFGLTLNELKVKNNWFSQALPLDQRERFRKYAQTGSLTDESFLTVAINEVSFVVQVTAVHKEAGRFHLTITEPAKADQVRWLHKNSRLRKPVHLILASHRLFGEGAVERWTAVKDILKQRFNVEPKIVMTSKKDFSDAEERKLGTVIQDIFFKPVDPTYFTQKIKAFFPELSEKLERISLTTVELSETLKTVNPVTVTEISEAGFIMEYYRSIQIGNFREVVLWQPYEIGAPELLATCNFVEENAAKKGVYNCHFVFFGATDYFLKHIRVWIRDNYVLSKESQAS